METAEYPGLSTPPLSVKDWFDEDHHDGDIMRLETTNPSVSKSSTAYHQLNQITDEPPEAVRDGTCSSISARSRYNLGRS